MLHNRILSLKFGKPFVYLRTQEAFLVYVSFSVLAGRSVYLQKLVNDLYLIEDKTSEDTGGGRL